MPERVRRLVETRLDRLNEREQQLLAVAAVIGCEFEFSLVQHAADLSELDAARGVEELVRRRLFQVIEERLDFTHDRIRRVVYDRLLRPSRTVLHTAVARAIEAVYAAGLDVHAPALGLHYREGGVWDRAVIFLMLAAAQALSRSAYRDASTWYEQALAGLAHLPATGENLERAVDARIGLSNAIYFLGSVAGSVEQLKQAQGIAESLGDERRLGGPLSLLAQHAWISGRPPVVQIYGERILAIAEETADGSLHAIANYYLGHGRLVAGDLPDAIARFRDVAEILGGATNKKRLSHAGLRSGAHRAYLGWCLAEQGQFSEAIQHARDAICDAEASEVAHAGVQAWSALTHVHTLRGEYPRSVECAERAMAIAEAREVALLFPFQKWFVGHAWARSGRIAEGLPLIRVGLEQLEAWGLWAWVPRIIIHLGEGCLLAGLIDEATGHAARALALARELGQRLHEAYALRLLGESVAPEDAARAEESYRAALALAGELRLRPLVAHCHRGLGTLYQRTHRLDQAQEHLTAATTMYREMDMRFWLEQAEAERRESA
jgi:tetratricopeptide (TPR) repeat protein